MNGVLLKVRPARVLFGPKRKTYTGYRAHCSAGDVSFRSPPHKEGGNAAPILRAAGERRRRVVINYSTGWGEAHLRYSQLGHEWRDVALAPVASSRLWCTVELDLPAERADLNGASAWFNQAPPPLLEFVLHNGSGDWDKPLTGANYVILEPGVYSIRNGQVQKVCDSATKFLLAADLDWTMVGDDEASLAFKTFWEESASLQGSRLVYNTGRALDKWLLLWAEKSWCLAAPDSLICSVGTKVYNGVGNKWAEDAAWSMQLDRDWDLDVVREAAYKSLARVGKERMHFRPPEEQNEHKVTCGVAVSALEEVQEQVQKAVDAEGLRAQLITSGNGSWRFLDIVSYAAGKHNALHYVQRKLGFVPDNTVACGDSGNDIDMLAGNNLAIVVSNAQPDLMAWVAERAGKGDGNGANRLLVTNQPVASGILEGLEYFGFRKP